MKIRIEVNGTGVTATLDDNASSTELEPGLRPSIDLLLQQYRH